MMNDSDLLTIEQARERLRCGKTRLYSLGKKGKLSFVKFGRSTRITSESVERVIDEDTRGVPKSWPSEMKPETS